MGLQTLQEWLDSDALKSPRELPVYTVEQRRIGRTYVDALAQRFGVHSEMQTNDDMFIMADKQHSLLVYKASGAFAYSDMSRLHNSSYHPDLPSETEAERIAVQYLKEHNWLPEQAVLDSIHVGQFEQVSGPKHDKRLVQPNHICVSFRLQVDALTTYGPGAKIKVYVGDKGAVIGVFHAAPKLGRPLEQRQRMVTGAELQRVLQRKLNFPLDNVEVKDARLAYFCESPLLKSGFIYPVYILTLVASVKGKRGQKAKALEFMTHPIPATSFAPMVTIEALESQLTLKQNKPLELTCSVQGGTAPLTYRWESSIDGVLSEEPVLKISELSVAHREGKLAAHTISVTVTDSHGYQDSHQIAVRVEPRAAQVGGRTVELGSAPQPDTPDDPYVGVEWCNLYHGSAPDISGTNGSAQGFKNTMQALPSWSTRFDWGNDAAWEEDFKVSSAAGGGTDSYWSDNVHFAFFAGHGSPGAFWFGSTVDDHEMRAQDARWGDDILNWIVLHACQTMRANFEWTVWCDAFKGLHQIFGFHTNTEGSTPPLGSRFAFWMSFQVPPVFPAMDMQSAWRQACSECFDASVEHAVIYANQAGTNTSSDHLPGYGTVSADPTTPTMWAYYRGTC